MLDMSSVYRAFSSHLEQYGVLWQTLAEANVKNPAILTSYLGRQIGSTAAADGTLIFVPKGVQCPLPLQARGESLYLADYRLLVIVEAGGKLELVTGCLQQKVPSAGASGTSEIFLHEGARLEYFSIKNVIGQARHLKMSDGASAEWIDIGIQDGVSAPILQKDGKVSFQYQKYDYADVPQELMERLPPEFAVEIFRETENKKHL